MNRSPELSGAIRTIEEEIRTGKHAPHVAAVRLFDQYRVLAAAERDAFVLALIGRVVHPPMIAAAVVKAEEGTA